MGSGAGPAVLSPDDAAPADEVPAEEAQAPIDLVSDSSESTGNSSDSDDSSVVAVVEPVDQAAAEVPCVADLMAASDFTRHLLNDLHAPMVMSFSRNRPLHPPAYWPGYLTLSTYLASFRRSVSEPNSRLPVPRPSRVPMLTLPPT